MPSESPKWIALVLSLIAIIISGLSWWESHKNRLINEETSRPVLIASKDFEIISAFSTPNQLLIKWQASLKNSGKTTAQIDSVQVVNRIISDPLKCETEADVSRVFTSNSTSILAGGEGAVINDVTFNYACAGETDDVQFFLRLSLTYTDPASGRQYSQDFSDIASLPKKDEKKDQPGRR